MEPRSNIEKPKDRKVKRQKNQKIEDMEIIEIKKTNSNIFLRLQRWNPISFRIHGVKKVSGIRLKILRHGFGLL